MGQSEKKLVASLDIGTSAVKCVIAELQESGSLNIVGVGNQLSRGLRKGVVINVEATIESIRKAHAQAQTMAGREINSLVASISGAHLRGLSSKGVVGIKHREVSSVDIERVVEGAKAVAIPADREVLHVIPQDYSVDEQDGIKDPLGISGVRLEAQVFIITASLASTENIVKCAMKSGLVVEGLIASPLAAARAVCWPEELELGVAAVDLGAGTTDIAVFRHGAIKGLAALPLGGNHITGDIAVGLRTPVLAAEEIKVRYGCAGLAYLSKDEAIEVPSTGDHQARILSQGALAEIIEPRVQEILMLVKHELEKQNLLTQLTGGLVLTGGTSQMPGLAALGQQIFSLPVRIGLPRALGGLSELVNNTIFSTSIGLLIQHDLEKRLETNLHQHSGSVRDLGRRVANWFSEHF